MSTWWTPAAVLGLACALFLSSCEQTTQCPDGTNLDAQGHCVGAPLATLLRLPERSDDDCSGVEPVGIPDAQCTSTFDGDRHFETEDEMAAFCAEYDCVSGGVTVGSTETTDDIDNNTQITSLAPLSCLKTSRFLYVGKTAGQFTRLELPQYVMSNGGMNITRTVGMTEISLPELLYVGGDLSVQNNLLLNTFSMASLRHVGEFFIVTNNASLPPEAARALRTQICPAPPTATTLVNNGHGAGVDDEIQDLVVRASRTTEFQGDGIGTLFVSISDASQGQGHKAIVARGTFDNIDFSGPEGEEQMLVVVGVPVTGNEYLVAAFLDDDGSGGGGGATSGDLVASMEPGVVLTSEALGEVSIQLDQRYP
jgi:hypothetical protein